MAKTFNTTIYKNHKHYAFVNIFGDGETCNTDNHVHRIVNWRILPSKNHIHQLIRR